MSHRDERDGRTDMPDGTAGRGRVNGPDGPDGKDGPDGRTDGREVYRSTGTFKAKVKFASWAWDRQPVPATGHFPA